MKGVLMVLCFLIFYFAMAFGGNYAAKNFHCKKAETNGATVIWIQHKLLGEACYVPATIDGKSVRMDAYDWLQYFVYESDTQE